MIRILLFLSIIGTIICPFTIDDELFIPLLITSIIFFIVEWLKRSWLDITVIVILWVLSLFFAYFSLLIIGMSGFPAKTNDYVFFASYYIPLLFLTIFNRKLNQWMKKEYKKKQQ